MTRRPRSPHRRLVAELRTFAERHPRTALKLMRVLVGSAIRKQHQNLRAARAARLGKPALFATPTAEVDVAPSARATLCRLLHDKGFDGGEVDAVCEAVKYFEVREGDVLLEAGQPWPYAVARSYPDGP